MPEESRMAIAFSSIPPSAAAAGVVVGAREATILGVIRQAETTNTKPELIKGALWIPASLLQR